MTCTTATVETEQGIGFDHEFEIAAVGPPDVSYHLPLIHRAVQRYCRLGSAGYEDQVQVAAFAVFRAAPAWDPSRSSWSSFCCLVAQRATASWCRGQAIRERRMVPLDDTVCEVAAPQEEEPIFDADDQALARRLVKRLPAKQRDIVIRYYGLGCQPQTLKQIAAHEGASVQGVHYHFRNAIRALRRMMAEAGFDESMLTCA